MMNYRRAFIISISLASLSLTCIIYFWHLIFNPNSIYDNKNKIRNMEELNNTIDNTTELNNFNFTNFTNITDFTNFTNITNSTNNEYELILVKKLNMNVTKKVLYYEFIKSISTGYYYGDWDNFSIRDNKFKDKKGEGYITIYKKKNPNYLLNLGENENCSKINVYLTLKDGKYLDNYLECNFTVDINDLVSIDSQNDSVSFILNNVSLSYSWEEYIENYNLIHLNNTFINLTFYKKQRIFQEYTGYKLSSNEFGNLTLEIKNSSIFEEQENSTNSNFSRIIPEKNFEISFKGIAYGSRRYSERILNYSIFFSLLSIIEIILTSNFVKLVNTNEQMALNTDIYTILFHIMWSSLICGTNFFFSLIRKSRSAEYAMPSYFYFFLFSIFLLRILFLSWRARNRNVTDMRLFRKKLLKFYLLFYLFLFITLISIKLFLTYFILTFILYSLTWIFQIIYSAKQGTKPPMSYSYIWFTSFSKIALTVYLKAYKNNIFEYRPNYLKVICLSLIIIIEAFILCIQKYFGAKFIIPKRFRKQSYLYYRKESELSQSEKESECVICLDKLGNRVDYEEEVINEQTHYLKRKLINLLEKIKKKKSNKEDYMKTPCHHIFHSQCLESWLNVKNQCPYCRQSIPPLED